MIGVQSYAAKAAAAVERARAGLERAERRLAEHDASRPEGDDADALFAWRRERRDLEDRLESDRDAVRWAEAKAAEAATAEVNKAADAAHAAAEKQAKADEKLVREMDELSRKLAAKRDELAASIARTGEANAMRGDRAFIVDAETRMRQRPGRVRPAILDEPKTVWFGPDGKRYATNQTYDESGCVVEAKDRVARVVVDVLYEERQDPPVMPERFSTAIRLVDIEGRLL